MSDDAGFTLSIGIVIATALVCLQRCDEAGQRYELECLRLGGHIAGKQENPRQGMCVK